MKHLQLVLKCLFVAGLAGFAADNALAQSGYPYSIMRDEPGTRPSPRVRPHSADMPAHVAREGEKPRRRARGSSSPSPVPPYQSTVTPLGVAPRTIETPGIAAAPAYPTPVPGYSTVPPPPTGLTGQSFGDKAIGCAHYGAGAGVAPGNLSAYTGSCINSR